MCEHLAVNEQYLGSVSGGFGSARGGSLPHRVHKAAPRPKRTVTAATQDVRLRLVAAIRLWSR